MSLELVAKHRKYAISDMAAAIGLAFGGRDSLKKFLGESTAGPDGGTEESRKKDMARMMKTLGAKVADKSQIPKPVKLDKKER